MKKINGMILLFVSISLTSIGTVFKIGGWLLESRILLVAGVISFLLAIGMILFRIASPGKK